MTEQQTAEQSAKQQYQAVRCLSDDEVRGALYEISRDKSAQRSLLTIWSRSLSSVAPARAVLGMLMRCAVRNVDGIHDLHQLVSKRVGNFLMRGIDSLEIQGLERATEGGRRCLFISNHRDIALDSLLLNVLLLRSGDKCARVATGDNLWELPPWGVLVMRALGCFTVERISGSSRALYRSYQRLSNYIQHLLHEQRCHVWLAQQAGRARSGLDRTDPAVLKMLHMANRSDSFADFCNSQRIVPTTISYEYDPCAPIKAERLAAEESQADFQPNYTAEVQTGLLGRKGRVQINVGEPLRGEWETPEDMAQTLTHWIHSNYKLWPTNFAAARRLQVETDQACPWSEEELQLAETRLEEQEQQLSTEAAKPHLWESYANAVRQAGAEQSL